MFLSGTVLNSDGIHLSESNQNKTAALLKLNSGAVTGLGNESSNKPRPRTRHLGEFDKGSNPIDDSVLDRIHPGLTGVQTCTAVNSLFFSSRQFLNRDT